jgi:tetratricopeptide (TPR) repeat protein
MISAKSWTAIAVAAMLGATGALAQQKPEATSLTGKPLMRIALPNQQKLEANLAQAEKDLALKPNDPEAIIWVGRRLGYLWRYQDAIAMFSKGIALQPENAKLYRHRGHRYITVREFDRAIADLSNAAALSKGKPDEIEPDGQPNAAGKPRSTLQFNIWYHLALAHYLKGDYQRALDAYRECLAVSTNDDLLTATSDWMWMTLMRLGRKDEADKLLARITPKMDILENASNADGLTVATQGYGVGNWYFVNGNRDQARQTFEKVVSGPNWSAFGYIAAEADLTRMR